MRRLMLLSVLAVAGCFAQSAIRVSTGLSCVLDTTPTTVVMSCAYQGVDIFDSTVKLSALAGNANGLSVGLHTGPDAVGVLLVRQVEGQPLKVQVSVNGKLVIQRDVTVPTP